MIRGARQHNLKNVNLDIPKNRLVVFTGLSGSGKSSMAHDTIYAEGQRRYVESLSSYARQFLGVMDKPDLDRVEGLSPAISIDQKSGSHNPRSIVGTVTEIYDYLRLLYARVGHPHCSNCGKEIATSDPEQITRQIWEKAQKHEEMGTKKGVRLILLSPVIRHQKGQFKELLKLLSKKGYRQVRIDGVIFDLDENINLIKTNYHDIETVIDRMVIESDTLVDKKSELFLQTRNRLFEAVENGLELSAGLLIAGVVNDRSLSFPEKPKKMEDTLYSEKFACPNCNLSIPEIEPRMFSFNSPDGACPVCTGLGSKLVVKEELLLAENLTLEEGAVIPLASHFETDTWMARLIRKVASENGFNTQTPINKLNSEQLNTLLYGTGEIEYAVKGFNSKGKETVWRTVFGGIVPELERRYEETTSDYVRSELEKYMVKEVCPECNGARLKPEVLAVTVNNTSIAEVSAKSITKAMEWVEESRKLMSDKEKVISEPIVDEIKSRLQFLVSVGLDYLSLSREAGSLAGGELQRIRLASQIGSRLTGILYILDEPTIGLHERDNKRLISTLRELQKLGNTLIVVEHDREMMMAADELVEFGLGAGQQGGEVVFQGKIEEMLADKKSLTGKYLSNRKKITRSNAELVANPEKIRLEGANEHNLKNIDVDMPMNRLVCVTGVSGSGKSTLVVKTLYEALARELNKRHRREQVIYKTIMIPERIKRVSLINQSPIGRTPRSNPATYTKVFDYIRGLFAMTQEAKMRGYKSGRFSFNVKGGRCESCQGEGQTKIEMQFMSDIYVTCEVCQGKRYNSPTLEVEYKSKNIAQVLEMTVDEAVEFFGSVPPLKIRLATLQDVGLGYIKLGQPAPTISGGEAQRVKLAAELAKTGSGHTIYILDEPTTGLHFEDLRKLLAVLHRLVNQDNTVIVIEHNLDLIKNADWIIDMGPEGGDKGGEIIFEGKVADIMKEPRSYTGVELKQIV